MVEVKKDVVVIAVEDAVLSTVCPDTVKADEEALPRVVCPPTVRVVAVVVARVEVPVTPRVPTTPRRYAGVDDPIPTFPFCRIVKREVPVEEATLNGLIPADPCTLKVTVEEVAFMPATVPLSKRVEVPRVVEVNQRVAKPRAPPDTPDEVSPKVDVATHLVEVPVVWSTIPKVPDAFVESRRAPVRERLVL